MPADDRSPDHRSADDGSAEDAPRVRRHLYFDAGCRRCRRLAVAVEQAVGGWFQARNLREPGVQELLDEIAPDRGWEPVLVETTRDGERRAYTGWRLLLRLLVAAGPLRTWRFLAALGTEGRGQ